MIDYENLLQLPSKVHTSKMPKQVCSSINHLCFFSIFNKKIFKHITNYNNYKLRYNTTKTMPQGAKYYVYPAAILKVIKSYIQLHITITETGIIKYKLKIRISKGSLQPNKVIAWVDLLVENQTG